MKKIKISVLAILLLIISPMIIKAETPQSFKETVKEEIKLYEDVAGAEDFVSELKKVDLSGYKTNDKKVNIYIFRGKTCGYCLKAIAYFASILDQYRDKINLTSYEVWYDDENAKLMNTVATLLDDDASGVPYIIIGKTSFVGYSEQYNDDIIAAIENEYKKQEKYDIMEHLDEVKIEKEVIDKPVAEDFKQTIIIILGIICGLLFVLIILIVVYNSKTKKSKEDGAISVSEKEIEPEKLEIKDEVIEEVSSQKIEQKVSKPTKKSSATNNKKSGKTTKSTSGKKIAKPASKTSKQSAPKSKEGTVQGKKTTKPTSKKTSTNTNKKTGAKQANKTTKNQVKQSTKRKNN